MIRRPPIATRTDTHLLYTPRRRACVVGVKARIVLAYPPGRNVDEVSEGQFLLNFETDTPSLCDKYRRLIRIDIVLSAREEISSSRLTPVKGANGQSDGGRNVGVISHKC